MPFVIDASIAIAWALDDEEHPTAVRSLDRIRNDEARVPGLWWYEVRNSLVTNERRRRLTEGDTTGFLQALSRLALTFDHDADDVQTLALARRHGLTIYDAVYLELAQRENIPLATLDGKLANAARAEKVPLIEDASL